MFNTSRLARRLFIVGLGSSFVLLPPLSQGGLSETLTDSTIQDVFLVDASRKQIIRLLMEGHSWQQKGTSEAFVIAREKFLQALLLSEEINDQKGIARSSMSLGEVQFELGRYDESLEAFGRALELFRKEENTQYQVPVLTRRAMVYGVMNNPQGANEDYASALVLVRQGQGEPETELRLLEELGRLALQQDNYRSAQTYLTDAIARYTALKRATPGKIQRALTLADIMVEKEVAVGNNQWQLGSQLLKKIDLSSHHQATEHFVAALIEFKKQRNVPGQILAYVALGDGYAGVQKTELALEHYQKAVALAQSIELPVFDTTVLLPLAKLQTRLGQHHAAQGSYDKAIAAAKRMYERETLVGALILKSRNSRILSEINQAESLLKQALRLSREWQAPTMETYVLVEQGSVLNTQGSPEQALKLFRKSLQLARQTSDQLRSAQALNGIGIAHERMGDPETSLDFFEDALLLAREAKDLELEATALNNLGTAYTAMGDVRRALHVYELMLPLVRRSREPFLEAATLSNIGRVQLSSGQPEFAKQHFELSLKLMRSLKDFLGEAKVLSNLGLAYDALGQTSNAAIQYEASLQLVKDQEGLDKAIATLLLGRNYYLRRKFPQAERLVQEGISLANRANNPTQVANGHSYLAQIYQQQGEWRTALEQINQAIAIVEEQESRTQLPTFQMSPDMSIETWYALRNQLLAQLKEEIPENL